MQRVVRMKRELEMLQQSPPPGISCWTKSDNIDHLEAQIVGGEGTPYEGGIFNLDIEIPDRYPFEPPKINFKTVIYHPNIDSSGRICLDSLKMPPKGAWKPALNISTLLTSIQLLMAEPNPDDPLMTDISEEYKFSRPTFLGKAKQWTQKYATDSGKENAKSKCRKVESSRQNKRSSADDVSRNADSEADKKKPKL